MLFQYARYPYKLALATASLCALTNGQMVQAQTADSLLIGDCEPGEATMVLEGGNLRAPVRNNGQLYWGDYSIPKDSDRVALFNVNLWLAGTVDGETRESGARYRQTEFWPGPLDSDGRPPARCGDFDHIYEIDASRDLSYRVDSPPSSGLLTWPTHLGAPYIDVDGETGYDPYGGDRPAMFGDQMLWWRMNDRGNEHRTTRSLPLGVDVEVTAYSYGSQNVTGNTSFYRYEITNRNALAIEDMWFGQRIDAAIGDGQKHSATDTTLGMIYFYYSEDYDEDILGDELPALGITMLAASHQPKEEYLRATSIPTSGFTHSMVIWLWLQREIERPGDMYDWLRGIWPSFVVTPDTSRQTEGIFGGAEERNGVYSLGGVTEFMYPGNPVSRSYWSMENIDNQGNGLFGLTNFVVGSYGPFDLDPGETFVTTVAIVWALGEDRLDSVAQLRNDASYVVLNSKELTSPRFVPPTGVNDGPALSVEFYPNPTHHAVRIRLRSPESAQAEVVLFDSLGRRVRVLLSEALLPGMLTRDIDVSDLPAGFYIVRSEIGPAVGFSTLIKL